MISTILTSLHIFGAISLIPLGLLLIAGSPRNRSILSIGWLVIVFGMSSIAFGLALNSVTSAAVSIWTVALLIFTYPVAPAALMISIYILRPNLFSKWFISVPLWVMVFLPTVVIFLDVMGATVNIFGQGILITLEGMSSFYTGGYLDPNLILTATGNPFMVTMLVVFYPLNFLFTTFVAIRDWKKDELLAAGALGIAITGILSTIVSTVFRELLPVTLSALISNTMIAIGYWYLGINVLTKEKGAETSWIQNLFGDLRMFNKMLLSFGIVLIPAVAFLSFSSFSFFQTSLITASEDNLQSLLRQEVGAATERISEDLNRVIQLEEANRIATLLDQRARYYSGLTSNEIEDFIYQNDELWLADDPILTSVTMDSTNNLDLRNAADDHPALLRLILVDPYGGLVTANQRPDKYKYISDKWLTTLKENEDIQTFVGHAGWNEALETYTAEMAISLHTLDGDYAGAVLVEYDLGQILGLFTNDDVLQIGYGLATPDGELFSSSGRVEDQVVFPTEAFSPLPSDKSWRAFEFGGISHLTQTAPIDNQEIDLTTPWSVVAYQPVSISIAPLGFVQNATLIIAFFLILINAGMAILFTQSITNPLDKLQNAAEQIQSGVRGAVAQIATRDEFGALASSFNQMSGELNQVMTGLEDTIDERTADLRKRANQLEASAVVAREAAGARDLSTLLETTVNLVPETFDYYHCGIFLLDEAGKFAVLQAANSEGGKRMLARGHKLQIGRVGVVGYCGGTGEPRIAQDVGADVTYYANPDMPDTRSEMALPLIVRDEKIGVLDIQSTKANAFTEEDIEVIQVLADQLALAIDNTRLMESSQKALSELQTLYGQEAATYWRDRLAGSELAFAYDSTGMTRAGEVRTVDNSETTAHLTRPITFRGQVIGELDFLRDVDEGTWTDEEAQLIEDILEQTALALENARLVQQIRLRSDQIRLLQEITSMAASILDEDELLEQTAEKLRTSLLIQHCGVILRGQDPDLFRLVTSSTPEDSDIMLGNFVNINEDEVSKMVVEQPENLVINLAANDPRYQVFVQTFCTRKKASLILLPLLIRDEVMGYIFLEDADEHTVLDEEENDLFNQISAQISTAVESARLFTAEQQGRMSAAALLEITQIASASLDINQVLNQATSRSAKAIQADRCSILLLDEHEKITPLVSINAKGVAMEGEEWARFQQRVKSTYKNTPIRTLAANMRQPQIINSLETYDGLPMDWAREFNVACMMSIPLISQNKVIGTMLYTQVEKDMLFHQDQIELAQTIAGQIATTIENANLFEQAVTRAERERQITEITAKIRSSNDPQVIMDTAITELRAALAESTIKAKQAAQQRQPVNNNGKETGNK